MEGSVAWEGLCLGTNRWSAHIEPIAFQANPQATYCAASFLATDDILPQNVHNVLAVMSLVNAAQAADSAEAFRNIPIMYLALACLLAW